MALTGSPLQLFIFRMSKALLLKNLFRTLSKHSKQSYSEITFMKTPLLTKKYLVIQSYIV